VGLVGVDAEALVHRDAPDRSEEDADPGLALVCIGRLKVRSSA